MKDQVVSHYRLTEKLGVGSHGEVWRGTHTSFEEMGAAIKLLHPELARDEDFIQRLKRECLVLHTLQHENIVGFRELVLSGDRPAMVMEYVEGIDGFERAQQGPVSSQEILKIGRDSLKGLAFAHKKGVVHRDLKPSNLFLCADGTTKLLDFGIAKAVSGSHATKTGTIQGTLQYMAPEVFSGKGGTVSVDIYALGLSLWELITGASACPEGSMPEQMGWHMMQGLESILETTDTPMWVNEDMLAVIKRMAAKDPADRYESIEAVLSDWEALSESSSPAVSPHASAESIPPGTVTLDLGKVQEQVENKSANTLPPDSIVLSKEAVMDHMEQSKNQSTPPTEDVQPEPPALEPAPEKSTSTIPSDAGSGGVNKTAIFVVAGLGCAGLAAAAAGIGAYFFISGVDEMASEQIAFDDLPEIADEALTRDQAISLILLQPNGGSSMWDEQIKSILLRAFDVDRSRSIDSSADLAQMDCEVWSALETSFLGGGEYTTSILSVYGFDNGVWMGDLLGFSDSIRSDAYADGSACKEEAPPDLPPPPTAAAPAAPPPVPVAAPAPSSGLSASQAAAQILALSGGGSNTWDDNVKEIMLKAFDSNDNGELDRSSEVSAVTCEVWSAIDRGMRAGGEYDASVLSVYGFDPELIWIGYAFGFAESRRSQAFSSGASCLGYDSGFAIPSAPPAAPSQGVSASEAAMMILSLSGGGSSEWDDQVESIMVSAFDTNGSGDLDTNSEVSSVTCQVWSAMDSGMRAGGQYSSSILTVYGFDPSLMWIGSAVGFSESKRSQAFSSGSACLGYGEPILGGGSNSNSLGGGSTTGAAGSIMSLSGGGSSEWDARVKSILLSNFDSNGSGSLDTGSEISSVSCDVWVAMDRSLKAGGEYSTSVLNVYGFNYGAWMGDLLGFSSSYRSEAFSIANACLGYPE